MDRLDLCVMRQSRPSAFAPIVLVSSLLRESIDPLPLSRPARVPDHLTLEMAARRWNFHYNLEHGFGVGHAVGTLERRSASVRVRFKVKCIRSYSSTITCVADVLCRVYKSLSLVDHGGRLHDEILRPLVDGSMYDPYRLPSVCSIHSSSKESLDRAASTCEPKRRPHHN
jgi:hypothetical protein